VVLCPYGRLQSVLTDDHTLVVGYDWKRGEPRGRADQAAAGDCVDCDRCVHVCPTGIDIGQGLQLECIGCAACVDACNDVMVRLRRPRGLIRYDSLAGLAGQGTRWLRPRTLLYGVLLAIGTAVAAWSLSGLRPASFSVTRLVGAPYYVDGNGVRNQFLMRLVNKRAEPVSFAVTVRGLPPGAVVHGAEEPVMVGPLGEELRPLIIEVERGFYGSPFQFEVDVGNSRGAFVLSRSMEFLGPDFAPTGAPPAPSHEPSPAHP
jgi:cytochrome c oxidase accessory protein FixG